MTALDMYEEQWHGFDILGAPGKKGFVELYHCRVNRGREHAFDFEGQVTTGDVIEAAMVGELKQTSAKGLALKRVHAIIDLRQFEWGETIERSLYAPREVEREGLSEHNLRRRLLGVFNTIRREHPKSYAREQVDVDGLCMELGIPENTYFFTIDYLIEKNWLTCHPARRDHYSTGTWITKEGIDVYDSGLLLGPVLEALVAETRQFVDSNLKRLSPKAAQKLTETYRDVIQDGTELKWSQVAFACRDILQDFTDAICDPQFLGIQIQVPAKQKTKNKLRAAMDARTPRIGETERELFEALTQYIEDYFDKLNDYIQKQVHPDRKAQVGSEGAKRCLVYTYLLIADVLSLLPDGR